MTTENRQTRAPETRGDPLESEAVALAATEGPQAQSSLLWSGWDGIVFVRTEHMIKMGS